MKRKFNQWWSSNCLIFFLFLFLRSNIKHICLNSEKKSDTKRFQFYPATFLCLSQAMDVNVICRGHFMLNGVRWEVNVRLVDIGEIVDHHFLYLLFLLAIVLSVLLRYTDSDYPLWLFLYVKVISEAWYIVWHLPSKMLTSRIPARQLSIYVCSLILISVFITGLSCLKW